MSTHYIANIKVIKVVKVTDKSTNYGQSREGGQTTGTRTKATIANLTVSDETLESLTTKLNAHLALLTDGGDIDD